MQRAVRTDTVKRVRVRKLLVGESIKLIVISQIVVVVCFLMMRFILLNCLIPSGSMEPTIMTDSRAMGLRTAYWFSEPQRGDVIIFNAPDEPDLFFVKRVVGLPGETLEIIDGKTYIDGSYLEEAYINPDYWNGESEWDNFGPYQIPEGSYFVMGDNRGDSYDARYWSNTFVEKDMIIGRIDFCYWPLSEFGSLKNRVPEDFKQ